MHGEKIASKELLKVILPGRRLNNNFPNINNTMKVLSLQYWSSKKQATHFQQLTENHHK
jgi:hypothetical protein